MTYQEITVAVGGGQALERAGLSALITTLPGLRVVAVDHRPPPQVLVWVTSATLETLPPSDPQTAVLLLADYV